MKFLVDAQMPQRFTKWLNEAGHDALHTLDLPKKNLTSDNELIARAMRDGRIVVSKDADFVQSLHGDRRAAVAADLNRQYHQRRIGENTARQFEWG